MTQSMFFCEWSLRTQNNAKEYVILHTLREARQNKRDTNILSQLARIRLCAFATFVTQRALLIFILCTRQAQKNKTKQQKEKSERSLDLLRTKLLHGL